MNTVQKMAGPKFGGACVRYWFRAARRLGVCIPLLRQQQLGQVRFTGAGTSDIFTAAAAGAYRPTHEGSPRLRRSFEPHALEVRPSRKLCALASLRESL